jgi:hypothetical protein
MMKEQKHEWWTRVGYLRCNPQITQEALDDSVQSSGGGRLNAYAKDDYKLR